MNSNFGVENCEGMEAELNHLREYLSDCDKLVDKLLSEFNWTKEEVLKEEQTFICPFDNGHRMKKTAFDKHVKRCELKRKGYTSSEINEILDSSEPGVDVKNAGNKRVIIDSDLQEKIIGSRLDVPLTVDRIPVDLNREQRLAIYEYVISAMNDTSVATTSSTSSINLMKEDAFLKENLFEALKTKMESKTEPSNKWELLATQRDMKRRKQSYRKSVHTSSKSYNEIVREVIENHCSYLRSVFAERMKKENEKKAKSAAQEQPTCSDYKSLLADTSKSVASIRGTKSSKRSEREDKYVSKHSSHKHKHKHRKHHKRTHESSNERDCNEKYSKRK